MAASAQSRSGTYDLVRSTTEFGRARVLPAVQRSRPSPGRNYYTRRVLPRPALDGSGWFRGRSARPPRAGAHFWSSAKRPVCRRFSASTRAGVVRNGDARHLEASDQADSLRRGHHGADTAAAPAQEHAADVGSQLPQLCQRRAGATTRSAFAGTHQKTHGFQAAAPLSRRFLSGETVSRRLVPRPRSGRRSRTHHRVYLQGPQPSRSGRKTSLAYHAIASVVGPGQDTDRTLPSTLGVGTDHRRVEDAPAGTSSVAQRNSCWGNPGDLRLVAGSLHRARPDVRSRQAAPYRPASLVVYRDVEDTALPFAAVPQERQRTGEMVRHAAGGNRRGKIAGTPRPDQPARHQTKDVSLAKKTSQASRLPPADKEVP